MLHYNCKISSYIILIESAQYFFDIYSSIKLHIEKSSETENFQFIVPFLPQNDPML